MNLGIYLSSLSKKEELKEIHEAIDCIINNKVDDVSIFYDDISYTEVKSKCGMFNSTDLWNFKGDLIVTSINCLYSSKNIVNNINLIYYYGLEKKSNLFTTLQAISIPDKIICKTKEDASYLYRISGKKIDCTAQNFKELLEKIS